MDKSLYNYILLSVGSFLINEYTTECENPTLKNYIINFLHHFGSTYLWFGGVLFNSNNIHLLITIITYLGWKIFDGCVVTKQYNESCNISEDQVHRDWMTWITQISGINYNSAVVVIVLYDLYRLNIL